MPSMQNILSDASRGFVLYLIEVACIEPPVLADVTSQLCSCCAEGVCAYKLGTQFHAHVVASSKRKTLFEV